MYKYRYNSAWMEPLEVAHYIDTTHSEDYIFLYSCKRTSYSGRWSLIAYDPIQELNSIEEWEIKAKNEQWFGYFTYEAFANENNECTPFIKTPLMHLIKFNNVMMFDHDNKTCYLLSNKKNSKVPKSKQYTALNEAKILSIDSNMSKSDYLQNINTTLNAIYRGDFYQANVTRKFYGEIAQRYNSFAVFVDLCENNPSPYSCYIRFGNTKIISSSPEMFLNVNNNTIETNPIKGTAPAFADPKKNDTSIQWLKDSSKDFSENLMIVDLMRNDLAKGCKTGSVQVKQLFAIHSYATLHHAISTVIGRTKTSIWQQLRNCFPPGSMTGAPKIKVMEWCKEIEKLPRGIYGGCIGWFNPQQNTMNSSVVIRTIVLQDNHWEFQVGGGIVAESEPLLEWEETLVKAKALIKVLNIPYELISIM